MKKLVALALALCLIASVFSGCSSPDQQPDGTEPQQAGTSEPAGIETDEKLLTVEITLPASMVSEDGNMSDFDIDAYVQENGFIDAVVNEDGSLTVTMTKAAHKEMLEKMTVSLEASFAEMVEAEDTPYIKEIAHSDDFSTVEMKVVRSEYENAWDLTPFVIGVSAMYYQAFLDMEYHCEISVIDVDTGDIISSVVYPDVLEESE